MVSPVPDVHILTHNREMIPSRWQTRMIEPIDQDFLWEMLYVAL